MTLTPEELALLPADVQATLTLAEKASKPADELSKAAHQASYEAGKDATKHPQALLAHAKAHAAHMAEKVEHENASSAAQAAGNSRTSATEWDASRQSRQRAESHLEHLAHHARVLGMNITPRPMCYGLEDQDFVSLRAWSTEKREKMKKGEIKGEFAGPDESFPIASPEDVSAAASSLGRAKGDTDAIKANIIRIAKKYGWESGLPEAWKEVKNTAEGEETRVVAFASTMDELLESITDPPSSGLTAWLPVLYPGKYNDLHFTAAMLTEMVQTFNPKAESCPVKIGHEGPDTQEELSQIREVKLAPCTLTNGKTVDTCLWVRMDRTPEALASQTKYRKTSIEAWPPTHQSNPTPGKWNLKGLAFLSATAPAVPNLPTTKLSASTTTPQGENPMTLTPAEIAELQAKNEANTAALASAGQEALTLRRKNEALELELASKKKEAKKASIEASVEKFSAKLTPAQMIVAKAIALALDGDEPSITLAEKSTPVTPLACFMDFLSTMKDHGLTDPLNVPSLSGKKGKDTSGSESEDDMSDADLRAKKIKEFREKDSKCPMADALLKAEKYVKDRNKRLKAAEAEEGAKK